MPLKWAGDGFFLKARPWKEVHLQDLGGFSHEVFLLGSHQAMGYTVLSRLQPPNKKASQQKTLQVIALKL